MHQTLEEFLAAREAELISQIADLRTELRQIKAARNAAAEAAGKPAQRRASRTSIKAMVRDVLTEHSDGGTTEQIIEWVKAKHGTDVPRNSMTPQLSRLKRDGELGLDGETRIWRKVELFQNDEGPTEAGPSQESGGVGWSPDRSSQSSPSGSIPDASTPVTGDQKKGSIFD